jgi:transcriptional regulator with XRE-family HTH domain
MKLVEARQARLLSVQELANKASCSFSTIANIERGHPPKRMDVVRRIARALQVHPALIDEFQLLAGTPETLIPRILDQRSDITLQAIEDADRDGWIEEDAFARMKQAHAAEATPTR